MPRRNKRRSKDRSSIRAEQLASVERRSSSLAKAVECALEILEESALVSQSVQEAAERFDRSPRKIWSSLLREDTYALWLARQDSSTLETTDRWSDRVAEIILSSSSDDEIDERILILARNLSKLAT